MKIHLIPGAGRKVTPETKGSNRIKAAKHGKKRNAPCKGGVEQKLFERRIMKELGKQHLVYEPYGTSYPPANQAASADASPSFPNCSKRGNRDSQCHGEGYLNGKP